MKKLGEGLNHLSTKAGQVHLPIIMVTALRSKDDRLRAVEAGINNFLSKPVELTEWRLRRSSLLRMKEAQNSTKQLRASLEATVERRTAELRKALEEITIARSRTYYAYLDTIKRLSIASEYSDKERDCASGG